MSSKTPLNLSHWIFTVLMVLGASTSAWAGIDLSSGFYGNQAKVDNTAAPVTLDNDNKQVGFSFRQRTTDSILGVWVYGTALGACPNYNAIIYDDDGGDLPQTLSSEGGDSDNMTTGWTNIGFTGGTNNLTAGTVYDVVLQSSGGATTGNCFVVGAYTQPLNNIIPLDQFPDGDFNTSYDDGTGKGFVLMDAQPVFAVDEATAGIAYGNPYAGLNNVPVEGTTQVSEVFNGPGTWVSTVGTYFEKVSGPAGPLNYQLVNLNTSQPVTSGTFSTSAAAPSAFTWADISLPGGPYLLQAGVSYRLSFSSSSSTGSAFYLVDGPIEPTGGSLPISDMSFDGSNAFSATSLNSGSIWTSNAMGDLAFRFAITGPPTATPTITRTPTVTLTPTWTSSPSSTPTSTATETPTLSPSITPTDSPTSTPTILALPSLTFTITLLPVATDTPTSTATPTSSPTITLTPTVTLSPTITLTATITLTSTHTQTVTLSPTVTATPTWTLSPTITRTPTLAPTLTHTPTPSVTPLPAGSFTLTPTPALSLYLDQNYFDPNVGIGMDLRVFKAGLVKVTVYNMAGSKVKELRNENDAAGNYRVTWDGTNSNGNKVGDGIYFVMTEQPSGRQIRKVIVLR